MAAQGFPAGQASPRIARFLWPEDSWPVTAPAAAIVMRIVRMYEEPGLRLYPMIDRVAQDFLQYFGPEDMTLSQGPTRESRTFWLRQQDGSASRVPVLLLEGRIQRGEGSDPMQAIYERYAHAVQSLQGTSAHAETILPAIGMEVIGNDIQFLALFHQDGIQIMRITHGYHFIDMRLSDLNHMENLVRLMHAVRELCRELCQEMAPHAGA